MRVSEVNANSAEIRRSLSVTSEVSIRVTTNTQPTQMVQKYSDKKLWSTVFFLFDTLID